MIGGGRRGRAVIGGERRSAACVAALAPVTNYLPLVVRRQREGGAGGLILTLRLKAELLVGRGLRC